MLNPVQASIERSIRKGKSVVWVTQRQTGKSYIGHDVARGFGSTAYVSPSHPIISHHQRNFHVKNLQYFSGDTDYNFYGSSKLSGYMFIVMDDFEHIPLHNLERVYRLQQDQRMQTLWLATKWPEFMMTDPVLAINDTLNRLLTAFHHNKFDIIIE